MKNRVWRAVVEVGFIVFLFYSNLLMGEFERTGMGRKMGLAWAIGDVVTESNFLIAAMAGLIGYIVFEFLRTNFRSLPEPQGRDSAPPLVKPSTAGGG